MRFLIIFLLIFPLFASSLSEMIEKAKSYEALGETELALYWYKKAALSKTLDEPNENEIQKPEDSNKTSSENSTLASSLKEERGIYLLSSHDVRSEERARIYAAYLDPYEDEASDKTIFQILSSSFGLRPYKSNYLLPITYDTKDTLDRKNAESKFQLSLQKEVAYNLLGLKESYTFAYTQRSWWQIFKESSPFRETNYEPEAFVIIPYKEHNSYLKAIKLGYLHQSNGQDGEKSRSWDRVYSSAYFQIGGLFVSPRVWYNFGDASDNSDIESYLGYGDLTLFYPWKRNLFRAVFTNNLKKDENRGGMTLEWTFPIFESGVFGFLQYYQGYGESMIDYNRNTRRIGLGFSLSR